MRKAILVSIVLLIFTSLLPIFYFIFYKLQINKYQTQIQDLDIKPLLVAFDTESYKNIRGIVVWDDWSGTELWYKEGTVKLDLEKTTKIICLEKNHENIWVDPTNILNDERGLYEFDLLSSQEFKKSVTLGRSQVIYSIPTNSTDSDKIIFILGCTNE